MLMKHKEAPLFSAHVSDDGARLSICDGREPSQEPNGILLASVCSDEQPGGQAMLTLYRGAPLKAAAEAGVHMNSEGTFLLLGGPQGKKARVRVEQETGKVEFVDEKGKLIWSTP